MKICRSHRRCSDRLFLNIEIEFDSRSSLLLYCWFHLTGEKDIWPFLHLFCSWFLHTVLWNMRYYHNNSFYSIDKGELHSEDDIDIEIRLKSEKKHLYSPFLIVNQKGGAFNLWWELQCCSDDVTWPDDIRPRTRRRWCRQPRRRSSTGYGSFWILYSSSQTILPLYCFQPFAVYKSCSVCKMIHIYDKRCGVALGCATRAVHAGPSPWGRRQTNPVFVWGRGGSFRNPGTWACSSLCTQLSKRCG